MLPEGWSIAEPRALWLLLLVPPWLYLALRVHRRAPALRVPDGRPLRALGPRGLARLWWLPRALGALGLALLVVALARPQQRGASVRDVSVEGIDIVIALDISTSMRAADFKPQSRFHVARGVLKDFIHSRLNDRLGLVVFAADAFTQCPLTLDYRVLETVLDQVKMGVIADGTAIGNAIATSVNRLRHSDAKSKVIILLTDGDNNAGNISPTEAAQLAAKLGIKIFPIMVGKGGLVPYPDGTNMLGQPTYRQVEIPVNPELLKTIATTTGGEMFVATDKESLEGNFRDILARLEKSKLFEAGVRAPARERFALALVPGLALLLLEILLASTRLRIFP